jgi:ATP-binding cassette subfamily B protein
MKSAIHHRRLWTFLWRYLRRRWPVLAVMVILMLTSTALTIVQPFFYKQVVDLLASEPDRTRATLMHLVMLLLGGLACAAGHLTTHETASRLLGWAEVRVTREIYGDVFAHVQRLSTRFHVNAFAGATSRKMSRGVDSVEVVINRVWFNFLPLIVLTIGLSIAMWWVAPLIGLVMVLGIILYAIVAIVLNLLHARYHRKVDEQDTRVMASLVDAITANATVKAFAAEGAEDERHREGVRELSRHQWNAWKMGTVTTWIQFMLITVIEGAVLLLAAWLWYRGDFTPGGFLLVTAYVGRLWGYLFDIGNNVREYLRAASHSEEMVELMQMRMDITDAPHAIELKIPKGAVELRDVTFTYDRQKRAVFDRFSCVIRPGEKVALVGHSGGGKSTFVKLLLRLYDLDSGAILIDGQNIAGVTQESLRRKIALVPQDPVLFHRSIAENITYARPDAPREAIERAAKLAHAHEFIEKLPSGYDTLVGERGVKLSGGERQRVAIARAILADCPILILDEATSSLDSLSESYIQDALEKLMQGRTTIVIAHRLSTIKKVDRILVVEKGKIIEQGSHAELLKNAGGLYKQLYDMQAGGFLGE